MICKSCSKKGIANLEKKMKRSLFLFIVFFSFSVSGNAQSGKQYSREDYILAYKDLAVRQMKQSGVPASIILAQGMLESNNGNSTLAIEANNHFGIKCHDNWRGATIYHDDDRRNECFRKYRKPEESFIDHSDFLRDTRRYAFLFDLAPTDYKGWARGLHKAGYATNPDYANMLIKIIEDNKLYLLDRGVDIQVASHHGKKSHVDDNSYFVDIYKQHRVSETNGVKYVVAKEGDSFESLAKELEMMRWQLFKYNDLPKDATITSGEVLYVKPKRRSASREYPTHIVDSSETLQQISQKYAVKLKMLYKRNGLKPGEEPIAGQKIYMRGWKPGVKKGWLF